jgi:hypothetical protein
VRSVFRLADGEQVNRAILEELIKTGYTEAELTVQFSLEKRFRTDDFPALLETLPGGGGQSGIATVGGTDASGLADALAGVVDLL